MLQKMRAEISGGLSPPDALGCPTLAQGKVILVLSSALVSFIPQYHLSC